MAKSKEAAPGTVAARVLVDCEFGKVNDVADVPADVVESYARSSTIDIDPEAVAYARTLPQNQPVEAPVE
jgi:hypothetical protein